ncbi:MAG: DNA repair protein RecO [Oscillospiraceae bacterium]|nr:DNA repair protein RecO [Oscillospiraceae bacterium]
MSITLTGLVLRETATGESAKYITVLTAEHGKISVYCHGARSLKSRHLVCTQQLCYSEFVLDQKGERYTLRESSLIESFFHIRENLTSTALAQYAVSVAAEVCSEENEEEQMLRFLLNTLHIIAEGSKPHSLVKAAFELGCACLCGFTPNLESCIACDTTNFPQGAYLLLLDGGILCPACQKKQVPHEQIYSEQTLSAKPVQLPSPVLAAMQYIVTSPMRRIYSFALAEEFRDPMDKACEKYLLTHLERYSFPALDFYRAVE